MGTSGAALTAGAATPTAAEQTQSAAVRIVGIACSARKGKTTAAALRVCLDAAMAVSPKIEVECIELAGLSIPGGPAAGLPLAPGESDDFPRILKTLTDARTAGIIVGTPVYFSGLSYLCKAFLDRLGACRKSNFALADKVGGVLSVGAVRNGGQELAIQAVHNALLCQEMVIVGDGRPTAHTGATLLNPGNDDIAGDEAGLATARNLGRRVAQVALRLALPAAG